MNPENRDLRKDLNPVERFGLRSCHSGSVESLFAHHFFNGALQSCKDAMGESSSLQDRSVLEVSDSTIAVTVCAFTGTKGLQDSP